MEHTYAVHFGAYPTQHPNPPIVEGWSRSDREAAFWIDGHQAFVSGSWQCWGPEDQEDGDNSLHVVINVPDDFPPLTSERLLRLRERLIDHLGPDTRLLDYAVVSDARDWSQQHHVATFIGSPEVVLHKVTRASRVSA